MTNTDEKFLAAVKHHVGDYIVAPGDEYDNFSWRRCDSCGTALGGYRNHAVLFNPYRPAEQYDVLICTDCTMWHASGGLPEPEWAG